MKTIRLLLISLIIFTGIMSCSSDSTTTTLRSKGSFTVLADNTTMQLKGEISSSSLTDFNTLYAAFPNIKIVNIVECGGSTDDEVNLVLALRIHQLKIDTHLLDNAEIASGGVDFFVAGINRSRGTGTKVGVHSWSDETKEATQYPVGDKEHLLFINFYVSIGFTQAMAEDFYYFTINSAPAKSIHWMTEAELTKYNIFNK